MTKHINLSGSGTAGSQTTANRRTGLAGRRMRIGVVVGLCAMVAASRAIAAPAISNLNASLSFIENGDPVIVDDDVTFSGGSPYGGGYIRVSLSSANTDDQFVLNSATNVNASGAISVDAGNVYLGNGSGRDIIGVTHSTENGLAGQALRIDFISNFANPSFEDGGGSTNGWTIVQSMVDIGTDSVAGWRRHRTIGPIL